MNLQESIRRILRENDYSPAGKEVTPNKIVVHKSNPMFRDKILQDGLKVKAGECYKIYVGYGTKCKPAIFATNSTNKRAWFDSTYDDDVWEINTEMIPDVKWFKDRHYESRSKHIVTFQDIPIEAISLKYKGSGSGDAETWDKNSPNLYESIRRILREETKLSDYIRRRANANDLERLVRDVKISISGGKDKSDALYDAIQNFISSNRERFKDYKWLHSNHLTSLIKYINSKLDEEPLNESILMKETSDQESVKDLVSEMGIYQTSKMFGGIKGLYSVLGFTGTQEEMIFIVDTIMRHEVPDMENICDFKIKPTLHSLKLYVEIPKYYPNLSDDSFVNKQKTIQAMYNIGTLIHRLGNGLVRGHTIDVSIGDC